MLTGKTALRFQLLAAAVRLTSASSAFVPPTTTTATRCLCGGGAARACWKCQRQLRRPKRLFCECGVVQTPHPDLNHYELLLGAEAGDDGETESAAVHPTYRVDLGRLANAMRRLQWQLHPDKFVSASDEERNLAHQQSAKVNAAYSCLADPVQRAVYLLALRGVSIPTEETGVGGGDLSLPQEFLAEILELSEALIEADRASIGHLSERVEADTRGLTDELAAAFDSGDLTLAKELTYRLKYFANIRARIREMT